MSRKKQGIDEKGDSALQKLMNAVVPEGQICVPDAGVGLGKAGEAAESEHGHEKHWGKGSFCQSEAAGDL